jgi:hypothetical protein
MDNVKDDKPKCETCAYWEKDDEPTSVVNVNLITGKRHDEKLLYGLCKRYAPARTKKARFIKTSEHEWCGEHQDFHSWAQSKHIEKIAKEINESVSNSLDQFETE